MPISPNMNLNIPTPTVTPGPQYAEDISSNFSVIDAHDHSPGSGSPVSLSGIIANVDFSMSTYGINSLKSLSLLNQSVAPGLAGSIYMSGNNLFWKDGTGSYNVQITNGNAVAVSGAVGFTGLPSGTASAAYLSGTGTFRFQSATNTAAQLDVGSVLVRKLTASSAAVTIQSSASLTADYSMTLPAALPSSNSFIQSDNAGNLSFVSTSFVLPAGVMMMYGGTSIPTGWLLCDGSVVSQSTYAALYAAVGTAFNTGGEGAGNFRLPNMQRRTAVGAGGVGTAVLGSSVGNSGGAESVTLAISEMPAHDHGGATGSTAVPCLSTTTGGTVGTNVLLQNVGSANTIPNSAHTHTISSQGGGNAHNNIQPSLVVNYIIKT